MNSIEQVKHEINLTRKEIVVQKRIFHAECETKSAILDRVEKWIDLIEEEVKRKYPEEGEK